MKRLKMILLTLLVLATSFSLTPFQSIEAATSSNSTPSETYGYKTGAWFDDEGNMLFVARNKKASSSIRYGTKAFIIRPDTVCNSDKDSLTAICDPLKGGSNQYVRLNIWNGPGVLDGLWKPIIELGECDYLSQYPENSNDKGKSPTDLFNLGACHQRWDSKQSGILTGDKYGSPAADAILVVRFQTKQNALRDKLKDHPAFKDVIQGMPVYLNTVFRVIGSSKHSEWGEEFTNLGAIRSAESWANKSFFRSYYDNRLDFTGLVNPLQVWSREEDDQTKTLANDRTIDNLDPRYDKTKQWPAGGYNSKYTKDEEGIKLEPSYEKGGSTYLLQCSYILTMDEAESNKWKKCTDSVGSPYFVRGAELKERNPGVSLGGTVVVALYSTADTKCICSTVATIPDKSTIEGDLPRESTNIGRKVTMQVDLKQPDTKDWEAWVGDKTDFQIKVRVYRTDQTDVIPNLSNTGAKAIWSKGPGTKLEPADDANPGKVTSVTKSELINYLKSGKVFYVDDLTNYPIPPGGTVSFRYNADVSIIAKDKNGKTVEIKCTRPKDSTSMTWTRPEEEIPDRGYFYSIPKYYSEIKEGSPQLSGTSSNETFDAMSGTPTTRSLYFASGGSEFIVDIEVEYKPKITQTRTYKSEFTSVVNGWAMSPIDGSKSDPAPPRPTPRQIADACGAPFTESVTQTSEEYIKGYTTGENPQPIMGTKYGWYQAGYDSHKVGGYVDTWNQTVTFDYMQINKVAVWKLDKSKVDGMKTLVGTDQVTASIVQGDPTIFYNISKNNLSSDGRLRYSLETDQHDNVYWNEGSSDNCLSNSKDSGPVVEQKKFDERRKLTTNVTAVSDFLILQISSGDQSVMYFEKTSNTAKVTDQLDVPTTDFKTMWTNNSLSAANWDQLETIKIGSYNGNYGNPANKYSGASAGTVTTVFDSKPAGVNRPARPSGSLRLMQTGLTMPVTLPNGEYITGSSSVFYKSIYIYNPDNKQLKYSIANNTNYSANGQEFGTSYSPYHSKVNDIVVHDPVSVDKASIVKLSNKLDQRTPESKARGGNLNKGLVEFDRILDPEYRQNMIPNGDAEIVNADGSVAGWEEKVLAGSPTFTSKTGVITGTSFEIGGAGSGAYAKTVSIKPNTQYKFEGTRTGAAGNFTLEVLNSSGAVIQTNNTGNALTFTSSASSASLRITIIKTAASGSMYADNLSLKNMGVQEFIAIPPVYVTEEVPNPDYRPAQNATSEVFAYTGAAQTFKSPATGTYTLEVWGAEGGTSGYGGKGGYSKGSIDLIKGEVLSLYVGGKAGWNGGGSGHGRASDAGGGASDVRRGGDALNNRIIVAGGGGGWGSRADGPGGAGGGATGGAGGKIYGTPGTGGTQTSGGVGGSSNGTNGSFGQGGSNNAGSNSGGGGGGGGWYGGGGGGNDYSSYNDLDDSGGGGGSGYVGGVTAGIMQSGVRSGDGQISISSPPMPAEGSPTLISSTLVGGTDTSPPSDAYKLIPIQTDPSGGPSAGTFVVLDYGFQLSFPNNGDFFGNGQWGWPATTSIRGKGFVDNMDTTEWTKEKYVKFNFNVIYNNQMYLANEWISLSVPQTLFDFYVPLANNERASANVEFKAIAINAQYEDNDFPTNKVRYDFPKNYSAKHSAWKQYQVDVIGRIGNMAIEDTGDFRFSNFFKQPLVPTQWLISNVVKKVDPNRQNLIIGDTADIRGLSVSASTKYLNTYGMMKHMEQPPVPFPLSPEKNNITALKNQPLRLGYEILTDIQTIGNYFDNLQVTPYYYHVNLQTGKITPLDIYMNVNNEYKAINKFGGGKSASVYDNPARLDWTGQAGRRNVTTAEQELTSFAAGLFSQIGGDTSTGKAAEPFGNYPYGNSQFMQLTGRNRTFIGDETTYGANKNPGSRLSWTEYGMKAQRWHYSYVLPSSAVAVKQGDQPTQANINAYRTSTGVIVVAADLKALGEVYDLQYTAPTGNGALNVAGTSWPLTSIPYPIIAVYSANKSSADDLGISGTH